MSRNYRYTYTDRDTGKVKHGFLEGVKYGRDVLKIIQYIILGTERNSKFQTLFEDYHGEPDDLEGVRNHLPEKYKRYAHSFNLLKRRLVSINQIERKYYIEIKLAPSCPGCLYNACGQRAHMIQPIRMFIVNFHL